MKGWYFFMANGVIYARYSSNHQREESIEGQLRECKAFAKAQNIDIINTYIDRALSAKTDDRPGFLKMIADSSKQAFDYVIVYQLDRFARNRYDSAFYKMKLKKNGVKVLSAKENITNDPAGIILESVLEGMAEYYSVELAQKVKRGMTENALAARWASGRIPFGYKVDAQKHLIPDPATGQAVTTIFIRFARGEKIKSIVDYLNSLNYKTSLRNKFNRSSFQRMIVNPVYIGTFRWNDIVLKNAVPPLIDELTFETCQRRIAEKRRSKNAVNRKSDIFLLTTKLKCAECGGNMVGISGTSRNSQKYYYYGCYNTRRHNTACKIGYINRDELEDAVFEAAMDVLSSDENIDIIAEQAFKISQQQEENPRIKELEMQKKETEKKIANLTKALETGLISETVMKTVQKYEGELKLIEQAIAREKILTEPFKITKQHIAFFLSQFRHMEPTKAREAVLNTLLREAVIKKESDSNYLVTVRFNYTATPTLSDTKEVSVRIMNDWWRQAGSNR